MTNTDIRSVRDALGLTQTQFAALLGVHAITVSRWESGTQVPTPYQLGLIQQFGVASRRKRRGVDEDIATVLVTAGAIAGLYLLLKWALEESESEAPGRGVHHKRRA